MKKIDMNIIHQCQDILSQHGVHVPSAELYENLLEVGLIHKNGKPTKKLSKSGLINITGIRQSLMSQIVELEHKYNLIPLKYIDMTLHNAVIKNSNVKDLQKLTSRIDIDNDIQMTYQGFNTLLSKVIAQRLTYLDSFITSGTLDKSSERLMTQNAEQAEHCLHDVEHTYPVKYSLFDWWALILYMKLVLLEVMPTDAKKYRPFYKSHMKFVERNFLEKMQKSGCSFDNALSEMQSQISFANRSYQQFKKLNKGGNQ